MSELVSRVFEFLFFTFGFVCLISVMSGSVQGDEATKYLAAGIFFMFACDSNKAAADKLQEKREREGR